MFLISCASGAGPVTSPRTCARAGWRTCHAVRHLRYGRELTRTVIGLGARRSAAPCASCQPGRQIAILPGRGDSEIDAPRGVYMSPPSWRRRWLTSTLFRCPLHGPSCHRRGAERSCLYASVKIVSCRALGMRAGRFNMLAGEIRSLAVGAVPIAKRAPEEECRMFSRLGVCAFSQTSILSVFRIRGVA